MIIETIKKVTGIYYKAYIKGTSFSHTAKTRKEAYTVCLQNYVVANSR